MFLKIVETNADTEDLVDNGYGLRRSFVDYRYMPVRKIQSNGFVFDVIELKDEIAEKIKSEAEEWVLEDEWCYEYSDDVYDDSEKSKGLKWIEIFDPKADDFSPSRVLNGEIKIVVKDDSFFGVVLPVENTGGNGWSGSSHSSYNVQLVDGSASSSGEACYSFSGEDSSKYDEHTYRLKKRTEATAPWEKG